MCALSIGDQTDTDSPESSRPLIVDVDGTLARTDLLWEGLTALVLRRPRHIPGMIKALWRGKASLKAYVAAQANVDLSAIPLEPSVVCLIHEAIAAGRHVILASGADQMQVTRLGGLLGVTETWGSDGQVNVTARAKLTKTLKRYQSFDYVGNSLADLPLWSRATHAFAANASPLTVWRARRLRPDLAVLAQGASPFKSWSRALRVHQWSKNVLLVLPTLAAHLPWSWTLLQTTVAGVLAFSLAASAVYLANDLVDLPEDRLHPTKRRRPLPAGAVSIPGALIGIVGLLVAAGVMARALPPRFDLSLVTYVLLAGAYCAVLRRFALVDVLALATLYTLRVVAGATLVTVPLSRWFLAFAVFFFLSLALAKRVVELQRRLDPVASSSSRRDYDVQDVPVLVGLGLGASVVSSLVYCLYITSDEIARYYSRPDFLWMGLLILLYWQGRVWLLAGRNEMTDDPVVFALRDLPSRVMVGIFLLAVLLASR